MKRHVSPVTVVLVVTLAFVAVMAGYWKGLLGQPKGKAAKMTGGGGKGPPPPPTAGLANVLVTTIAGPLPRTLAAGEGGWADGQGPAARFDGPSAVAVGSSGAVYVTDSRNHRIRRVAADGTVTTVAGSGPFGCALGDCVDGPAGVARLWNPSGLAVGPGERLYFTDAGSHRVRSLVDQQVRSVAGAQTPPDAFGFPTGGFADGPGPKARFCCPTGIALRSDGSLLVVDSANRRVRKVSPGGETTTLADLSPAGAMSPCGIALAPDGRALVTDPEAAELFVVSATGAVSRVGGIAKSEIWVRPTGIAVDPEGVIYVADAGSHCIMRLRLGEGPEIIAGMVTKPQPSPGQADGPGDQAQFAMPSGIACAGSGTLYVADFGSNSIRKLVIGPPAPQGSKGASK